MATMLIRHNVLWFDFVLADTLSTAPPNWGIAPTCRSVWTTCPGSLPDSGVAWNRTPKLGIIGSDMLTSRLSIYIIYFDCVSVIPSHHLVASSVSLKIPKITYFSDLWQKCQLVNYTVVKLMSHLMPTLSVAVAARLENLMPSSKNNVPASCQMQNFHSQVF